MKELLKIFNASFKGSAKAKITDDRLEITIGTQTITIKLPEVIGGQNEPKD
jgi:hypothetical protein